jgi:flagellar motor switch protein FliN
MKRDSLAAVENAGTGAADIQSAEGTSRNLDAILRIPVTVQVVLGSAVMPVSNLMKLGRGTVIPLDQHVGEPVDIVVNGRVVARGEVVVADEDTSRFGVSLTELLGPASAGTNG